MSFLKKAAFVAAVAAPSLALAAGPDLTSLTDSVKFDTVITAVLAIAGSIATVYLAIRGAKIVLGMIRGG
ncbi:hypothetical protein [Vogesella mureinivorans]|uniref:hypothetical protein n=1 Tax=Vogesella mureinivorans TaxID=657276 RepID=UPI0011C7FC06|nr:hypothetical protein [Vogesella mureinivorans]